MKKIFRTVTLTAIIVGAGFTVPADAQQPVPKMPQPTPPVQRPTPQPCLPQSVVQPCPENYHPASHSQGGQVTGGSASAYGFGVGGSVKRDETHHHICLPNEGSDKKIDLKELKPCPKP